MKLHILSDLHLEFHAFEPPPTEADVVILAGDIAVGQDGIDWARQQFSVPVIYVPGNHEYYHWDLQGLKQLQAHASGSNVHVLDQECVVIDGVRFLGATLWTDFDLYGASKREHAMMVAQQYVLDFQVIADGGVRFSAPRSRALHSGARRWLKAALAKDEPGVRDTVVVTHHGPHRGSLAARFASDLTSAAFISNLDELMGKSALWIHGHTHNSFDYGVEGTRIVCNPRGYISRDPRQPPENPEFIPGLVVEV